MDALCLGVDARPGAVALGTKRPSRVGASLKALLALHTPLSNLHSFFFISPLPLHLSTLYRLEVFHRSLSSPTFLLEIPHLYLSLLTPQSLRNN